MKSYRLYLAVASLMILAACSNEDELSLGQTPETCVATITVNVNEAATRATYDTGLNFSWSEGDALSVVYQDGGTLVNKKFTIDGEINGNSATFTCSDFPTGTKTVGVYYPYDEDGIIDIHNPDTYDYSNISNYTVLYATGVSVADGDLGSISLSHATSYLKFPKGFQFFSDGTDFANTSAIYVNIDGEIDDDVSENYIRLITYGVDNISYSISEEESGYTIDMVNATGIGLEENSALSYDIYLPFFVKPESEKISINLHICFNRNEEDTSSKWAYADWKGPEKTLKPGVVYTATSESFPAKSVSDVTEWNN